MLLKIAGDSSSLKKACEAASEHLDTLGNAAKAAGKVAATALAGIGTAAAGIAVAATSVYTEHEKAANSLAAATGATGKELENLQSAMETVYQNNFGESIEDAAGAVPQPQKVRRVRRRSVRTDCGGRTKWPGLFRGTDRHHQRIFQPILQAGLFGGWNVSAFAIRRRQHRVEPGQSGRRGKGIFHPRH